MVLPALTGSISFYEGHSIQKVTFPIRVFKILGVKTVIGKILQGYMKHQVDADE